MVALELQTVADLVIEARAGKVAAFGELVDRFQSMAAKYAASLLQDAGLAEDACQEAFVDAFLHLHQLRDPAAFPGWFRRIVVKHADRQRRSRLLFAELHELPGAVDPLEQFIRSEGIRQVVDHVAGLPKPLRRAVELFYGEGYSVIETAEFLNVPTGAVRKRLFDARRKLRAELPARPMPTMSRPRDSIELLIATRSGDARAAFAILSRRPDLANLTERSISSLDGSALASIGWGLTVLQRAAFMCHVEVAAVLIKTGARLDPPSGRAPLDIAVLQGHVVMVRTLLESGADVTRPPGELTPLHRAAMRGALPVVTLLLAGGADPVALGPGGRTPGDWARLNGYLEVAAKLKGG